MFWFALFVLSHFAQHDLMAEQVSPFVERRTFFVRMDGWIPAKVRPHRVAPGYPVPDYLELHFADYPMRGCFFKVKFNVNPNRLLDPPQR